MPGLRARSRARDAEGVRLHRHRGRSSASRYWFVLDRTRFGFDLRATGRSERAAVASGVNVKRMVVTAMLHLRRGRRPGRHAAAARRAPRSYSLDFPAGLGFTGIAIALLGRNNPVGIAFAALLWAFLDASSTDPGLRRASPRRSSLIMQGVIVLSRRHRLRARPPLRPRAEQQRVGARARRAGRPRPRRRRCRHERHDDRARRRGRRPQRPRRSGADVRSPWSC